MKDSDEEGGEQVELDLLDTCPANVDTQAVTNVLLSVDERERAAAEAAEIEKAETASALAAVAAAEALEKAGGAAVVVPKAELERLKAQAAYGVEIDQKMLAFEEAAQKIEQQLLEEEEQGGEEPPAAQADPPAEEEEAEEEEGEVDGPAEEPFMDLSPPKEACDI